MSPAFEDAELAQRVDQYRRHKPSSVDAQISALNEIMVDRDSSNSEGSIGLAWGATQAFMVALVRLAATTALNGGEARIKVVALEIGTAAVVLPATQNGRHLGILAMVTAATHRECARWAIPLAPFSSVMQ